MTVLLTGNLFHSDVESDTIRFLSSGVKLRIISLASCYAPYILQARLCKHFLHDQDGKSTGWQVRVGGPFGNRFLSGRRDHLLPEPEFVRHHHDAKKKSEEHRLTLSLHLFPGASTGIHQAVEI